MSDMQAFFAQNADVEQIEEFVVSGRFRDKDGKPIPWKLRTMTQEESEVCRKESMKPVKGKHGRVTREINADEYVAKMITASVVYPNLKDAELQKSYGVIGAEALARKMLLPGEYAALAEKIQRMNGFNIDINDEIDEIKN